MAKDFKSIKTSDVYSSVSRGINRQGQQEEASPAEQRARRAELATQGRKGCKAYRINMAFTPENHDFIKILSKASGRTMTQYVNELIASYRAEHPEHYEKARQFIIEIGGSMTDEE